MLKLARRFLQDETAQDLIEYTLLVAFVALAVAALFLNSGTTVSAIWGEQNQTLSKANSSAS